MTYQNRDRIQNCGFYNLIFVGTDKGNMYIVEYFDLIQSGYKWLLFGKTDNILANITSCGGESGISVFRDDTVCVIDGRIIED